MVSCSFRQLELLLNKGPLAYYKQEVAWLQHMIEIQQAEAVALQKHIEIERTTPVQLCAGLLAKSWRPPSHSMLESPGCTREVPLKSLSLTCGKLWKTE